ncbi:GGDEF domain-containing protein [Butyrivibrio sp. LC3010]|uniref:GGDEF domain-containing protein n=1 Tax=Butyrivibrio sp. LC3010 TaxID=1280680 RepID=UPI000428055D|nr:GGDEF domain-containing protein [Butyrivibrio sp. LC3010]
MKKRIIFLIISILTFIVIITICHFLFLPKLTSPVITLDKNWNIQYNDFTLDNVSIKDLDRSLPSSSKGDILRLSTTLQKSSDYSFPTLMFLSRYSAVEVYIDNKLVLSKFTDKLAQDKYIGCFYNIVTVPSSDNTQQLDIILFSSENSAYRYFISPTYGEYHDVIRSYIFKHIFPLSSAIFLIIFGIAFLIITLSFYKTLPTILSQLFSSLLFINVGIWMLCYFKLLDFFINTHGITTEIEYLSLYITVPLTYIIIGCIQDHYKDWIFLVVASTSSIICIFLIVLHFSDIARMNRTLRYFQCISLMCSIFLIVVIAKDIKQKKISPSETIELIGLSFFSLSYILNFVAFTFEIFHIFPESFLTVRLIPMGGLIFVFANLINYFIYISESFAMRKEYASLTHLAYADGLTDLPNRSRYDKYTADLDKGTAEYCIISLDLNGLKEINDNDGHAAGDKYLQEFSSVLKQCFDEKCFIARIGGDEFVAILKEPYFSDIDSILTRLKDALEIKNILYPGYRRSVACGYAFSTEVNPKDSHSVYLLADKRMYENKKIMHERLGIAARI